MEGKQNEQMQILQIRMGKQNNKKTKKLPKMQKLPMGRNKMKLEKLKLEQISPNPFQPREEFKEEELQELADNIKAHGLIEPIVVTPKNGKYMIVAGERRWRAHNKAGVREIYGIVKDYGSEAEIKRDSLVENEIRENLSNSELKAFSFSLAKSLGEPYFKSGFVNVPELVRYIMGRPDLKSEEYWGIPLYGKLKHLFAVEKKGFTKLKNLVKQDKINLQTASLIASVQDKQTQNELVDMAKQKSISEVKQEVQRRNFEQKAKQIVKETKKSDEETKYLSEVGFVSKFSNKINGWNDSINYLANHLKDRKNFERFSHKSKLEMLDRLKPLKRDMDRAQHLITKLMEVLAK